MRTAVAAATAGAAAFVINWALAVWLRGQTGAPGLSALTALPIAQWTVLGTVGAAVVYALIRRYAARPVRTFLIVSAAVLILSFIPDVLIVGQTDGLFAGATWGAAALLASMHVVVAVLVVVALLRFAPPPANRPPA